MKLYLRNSDLTLRKGVRQGTTLLPEEHELLLSSALPEGWQRQETAVVTLQAEADHQIEIHLEFCVSEEDESLLSLHYRILPGCRVQVPFPVDKRALGADMVIAVNLNGARNTIQAVLPHMLHEKAGVIVNISSIWGQHGASCEVTYSCTKHALIGLTRSLAMELAPSGIRVNCVAPGVIDTDMVQVLGSEVLRDLAEQTPLGRLGTPQDIANAVAFLVSEKASFITGQVLTVDGAFVG